MKNSKILVRLLYLLPFVLFFSYHPVIPLGSTNSTNLELSLPLLWLIAFSLFSLPNLHLPKPCVLLLFPVYLTASILWSPNKLRALLTAGIFWCLLLTILTIPKLMVKKKIKVRIVNLTLLASVLVALFCWLQCVLDILNVDPSITLLCKGCTYRSFGFPHPNGFAIEPQFMGNLLLAPCFLSLYLICPKPKKTPHSLKLTSSSQKSISSLLNNFPSKKLLLPTFLFLLSTLFLTFSRGAIYAFLLGLTVFITLNLIMKNKSALRTIPLALLAFLISLLAQGTFSALSPTTDTFYSGIAKSLHQLTLGHLDLRRIGEGEGVTATGGLPLESNRAERDPREASESGKESGRQDPRAQFDGYVSESTEVRLSLTNFALKLWSSSPKNLLFGTGLASSGTALYDAFPDELGSPKEIVQNEYATLLLELGLVGVLLLLLALVALLNLALNPSPRSSPSSLHKALPRHKNLLAPPKIFLLSLTLSYAATLFFFSGLPNALHIYLLPPLLASATKISLFR